MSMALLNEPRTGRATGLNILLRVLSVPRLARLRHLPAGLSRTVAVMLCCILAGCGGNHHHAANEDANAQLARVEAILPEFDAFATRTFARSGVPGMAVAIVQGDQVVYMKSFGSRQAGMSEPVDADTVFPLASLSKPLASTTIAAILDSPQEWDSRIAALDPSFSLGDAQATDALTLRDLLSMRSGLHPAAGDTLEELGYGRREVLRRLRYLPLSAPFRQRFQYTNFGFTEAASALAGSLGVEWEDLAQNRLYAPLRMDSTSSRHADFLARANRVHTHILLDGTYRARFDRDADAQSPAGGVSSSVRDLSVWLRLLLANGQIDGRRLIDADVLEASWEPAVLTAPANESGDGLARHYALGWNVMRDENARLRLSHSGAFNRGVATAVQLVPAEGLGIVVLTNAAPAGLPEALTYAFVDLALSGKAGRDWYALFNAIFTENSKPDPRLSNDYGVLPAAPVPALPLAAYTGRYVSAYYGALEIIPGQQDLTMLLGPRQLVRPLRHWSGNTFVDRQPGNRLASPAPGGDLDIHFLGGLIFSVDASGRAARVRLDELDQHGEGDFVRVD
jgi:CubicO group peptidase (beta-lactamase class C family)